MNPKKSHGEPSSRILRLPVVEDRTGLKRTAIYAAIRAGTFPAPIKLTIRSIGFLESEVEGWITAKAARRNLSPGSPKQLAV